MARPGADGGVGMEDGAVTKEQRGKLRTLALAATPGEWYHVQAFQRLADERTIHGKVPGQRVDFVSTERKPVHKKIIIPMEGRESTARSEDMAYIAAANPATVLALLDRVDELEGDAERYRWIRANCLSVTDLAATRIGASDEAIDKARGQ